MNGFAEAAIGLTFVAQLAALDTVLTLHWLTPSATAKPAEVRVEKMPPAQQVVDGKTVYLPPAVRK